MLSDAGLELDLALDEDAGFQARCAHGRGEVWTRKQAGIRARGTLTLDGGASRPVDARAVIDDTAGYYARHTRWQWCAGVGQDERGRGLAWNLVAGVNDPPQNSERTVWVDGAPHEVPPGRFAENLSGVDELRFTAEAVRQSHQNLLLVRSDYRQPFGTFSGRLPGGIGVAEGYGVMEEHDVWW